MKSTPFPISKKRFADDLLDGEVALVTGGGSGMGQATALEMCRYGAKVVIYGRRLEALEETATLAKKDSGAEIVCIQGDIREPDQAAAAMSQIKSHLGKLDILVNNAGGQFIAPAKDISIKGFEAVIRNNLIGTYCMTKSAAEHFMYEHGGRVICVTAVTRTALNGFTHTIAARGGVNAMIKTLASEWAEYGIRLNCVCPGTIKTSGFDNYPIPHDEWHRFNRSPLNRMGQPEDIAGMIIFLASELGNFITGEEFYVDGGETLHLAHDARDMIDYVMMKNREKIGKKDKE